MDIKNRYNLLAIVSIVLMLLSLASVTGMYFSLKNADAVVAKYESETIAYKQFMDSIGAMHQLLASGKTDEAKSILLRQKNSLNDSVFSATLQAFNKLTEHDTSQYVQRIVEKEVVTVYKTKDEVPCGELEGKYAEMCRVVDSLASSLKSSGKPKEFLAIKSPAGKQIFYVGEQEGGKANGRGIGIWYPSGSVYEGDWKDNKRHGFGHYKWADGESYKGEYKDDHRHGTGIYFWKNGQRYEGGWADDMREGEGVVYHSTGKEKLRGVWKKDNYITK